MEQEILTSNEKKPILKLTIREFRNNFSKYWVAVKNGTVIIVYNRKEPVVIVSPYTK